MKKHFNQAEGTPLTSEQWNARFVDDEFVHNIQNGENKDLEEESLAV